MRERESERARGVEKKKRSEQREADSKKGGGKSRGSYKKSGNTDPNWKIRGDGCLGSKSHCIINIMAIIHTLFLQLSPGRAQFA